MKRDLIRSIYEDMEAYSGKQVVLGGWARSIRDSKAFGFIDLNDEEKIFWFQPPQVREKRQSW